MKDVQKSKFPTTLDAIGQTPIVQLQKIVPEGSADILVKLEYFNTTGSYKDRMALAIIEEAEKRGDLQPGMTVVEYTGGSTGSSLAFVCALQVAKELGEGKTVVTVAVDTGLKYLATDLFAM